MFDDPFFDTKSVCNVQNRFTTFISTGTPGLSRWLPRGAFTPAPRQGGSRGTKFTHLPDPYGTFVKIVSCLFGGGVYH